MFYSVSAGGFYLREIHGDKIPQDAVGITAEEHAALLAGQSQGRSIVAGAGGFPELQDPQPVDWRSAVMADFKSRREIYLNRLTGIAGRATRAGDVAVASAADAFSLGLLDLPELPAVVAAADADALKAAIMARYGELVAAALVTAPESKAIFDKVSE